MNNGNETMPSISFEVSHIASTDSAVVYSKLTAFPVPQRLLECAHCYGFTDNEDIHIQHPAIHSFIVHQTASIGLLQAISQQ